MVPTRRVLLIVIIIGAFTVDAISASGVQASGKFTAGAYPAILTGTNISHNGSTDHVFTLSGGNSIRCSVASLSATVTAASESVSFTPTYEKCTSSGLPVTFTMNGCHWEAYLVAFPAPPYIFGVLKLVCPANQHPEIHLFSSAAKHAANEGLCTYSIAPESGYESLEYVNTSSSPDDVDVIFSVSKLNVSRTGSILCGASSQTAIYTGASTLKAYAETGGAEGSQVGLTISE